MGARAMQKPEIEAEEKQNNRGHFPALPACIYPHDSSSFSTHSEPHCP
jgi:hypothetical protein